jgi:site-specific recombinase XerD
MGKAFYFLRPSKSNLHSLCVGLRHTEGQFLLNTGIKINPKHWNTKRSEVKNVSLPELDMKSNILQRKAKDEDIVSFTNNTLNEITNFIDARSHLNKESIKAEFLSFLFRQSEAEVFVSDLHRFCIEFLYKSKAPTKESLISEIDRFLYPPKKQHDIFEYIETFISDSESGSRLNDGKRIAYRTIQRYRTTQKLLHEFKDLTGYKIAFNSIDKDFIDAFNSFMAKDKNYSVATMGKHVQTFKSFLTEATEDGINTNQKFKGKSFATKSTVKDSIALKESELKTMFALDLSKNERLEKVRDLFVVGSWTGLRFSDFTDIKPENIKKDKNGYFIEKIQFKTKDKVVIPLNNTVLAILKKYGNQLPQAISNQKFNDYIKEVALLVPQLHEVHERSITKGGKETTESNPKYELISSHTARRSFATNAYERGVPTLSIMAITSHKTEKSFMAYIKTDKEKHSEIFRKHSK